MAQALKSTTHTTQKSTSPFLSRIPRSWFQNRCSQSTLGSSSNDDDNDDDDDNDGNDGNNDNDDDNDGKINGDNSDKDDKNVDCDSVILNPGHSLLIQDPQNKERSWACAPSPNQLGVCLKFPTTKKRINCRGFEPQCIAQ